MRVVALRSTLGVDHEDWPAKGFEDDGLRARLIDQAVIGFDGDVADIVELAGNRAFDTGVGIRNWNEPDLVEVPVPRAAIAVAGLRPRGLSLEADKLDIVVGQLRSFSL